MTKYIVKPEDKIVVGIVNRKNIMGAADELSNKLRKHLKCVPYAIYDCFIDVNNSRMADIKATAVCDKNDEFSEDIGKDIVDIKLSLKYHTSMVKKYEQLNKIFKEILSKIRELKREHQAWTEMLDEELKKYL